MTRVDTHLPTPLAERLRSEAARRGCSMTTIVKLALVEYLPEPLPRAKARRGAPPLVMPRTDAIGGRE